MKPGSLSEAKIYDDDDVELNVLGCWVDIYYFY